MVYVNKHPKKYVTFCEGIFFLYSLKRRHSGWVQSINFIFYGDKLLTIRARHVKFGMEADHKHAYTLCMKYWGYVRQI
jgi:hypothetical protein